MSSGTKTYEITVPVKVAVHVPDKHRPMFMTFYLGEYTHPTSGAEGRVFGFNMGSGSPVANLSEGRAATVNWRDLLEGMLEAEKKVLAGEGALVIEKDEGKKPAEEAA